MFKHFLLKSFVMQISSINKHSSAQHPTPRKSIILFDHHPTSHDHMHPSYSWWEIRSVFSLLCKWANKYAQTSPMQQCSFWRTIDLNTCVSCSLYFVANSSYKLTCVARRRNKIGMSNGNLCLCNFYFILTMNQKTLLYWQPPLSLMDVRSPTFWMHLVVMQLQLPCTTEVLWAYTAVVYCRTPTTLMFWYSCRSSGPVKKINAVLLRFEN